MDNNIEQAAPVARRRRSLVEKPADAVQDEPIHRPAAKGHVFECLVAKETLANALSRVTGIVERKNTIPITGCVKIEVNPGKMVITGTDMDAYAVENVKADVAGGPAEIAVDAHKLNEIVAVMPKGSEIKLVLGIEDGARLKVTAGRSTFNLPKLDAELFPIDLLKIDTPFSFTIRAADLLRLFSGCAHAMSTEETRAYLNGIFLHPAKAGGNTVLRAVATDGHRLARFDAKWPGCAQFNGVILPRKFVYRAISLLSEAGETANVVFSLSDGQARLSFNGSSLMSKLVYGEFPDYARVIPPSNSRPATISASVSESIKRVSVMASDKGRGIRFNFSNGVLSLNCANPEYGDSTEEFAVGFEGEELEIGFNAGYALEMLERAGDEVEFQLNGPGDPAVIVAPGESVDSAGMLFVLMPMRV